MESKAKALLGVESSTPKHKSSIFHWDSMPTVTINLLLNSQKVLTGEYFDAKVIVDSSDAHTIVSEFVAEVRGIGRTGWVNIHTDKIYETEREYVNITTPLCKPGTIIPPGRTQFPLRVLIPQSAPSSYDSQFGAIRYFVRIVLLTNSERATIMETFPFVVVAASFFDDIPNSVMQQIDYKDEVDFTVCSLPFGTVYIHIGLPRTGFCLNESIHPMVHIRNATRKALSDCSLQLVLKTQFEATSRYEHANDIKLVEKQLDRVSIGRVKGRSEATFDDCRLRVPENAVPSLQTDRAIILLSYVLQLTANPGIETEIPLVITSMGFRNPPPEVRPHPKAPTHPHILPDQSHHYPVHYL